MISLIKFKEFLGEDAQGLTDEQIESIRDSQYQFARLAFEKWVDDNGLIDKIGRNKEVVI